MKKILISILIILFLTSTVYFYLHNKKKEVAPITQSSPNTHIVRSIERLNDNMYQKIATSSPEIKTCEEIPHFTLASIPIKWTEGFATNNFITCLRPTTIMTNVKSKNYEQKSDGEPGSGYGNLVLVNGASFQIYSDTAPYINAICDTPSLSMFQNKPIMEKESITIDGYTGKMAHIREPAKSPSPEIDYYHIRIPARDGICQAIDFVSVVSTSTDNRALLESFLQNLKFYPGSSKK